MARRKDPRSVVLAPPIPDELRHRPQSDAEIAHWVHPDEQPPEHWAHELYPWRVIAAHARWSAAGRAWCGQHGLRHYDVIYGRDAATAHRWRDD